MQMKITYIYHIWPLAMKSVKNLLKAENKNNNI